MSTRQQEITLRRVFCFWRDHGFPYPRVSADDRNREFERLQRVKTREILTKGTVAPSTVGLRLANSYHPQMWHVPGREHTRSAFDYFEDDDALRKILRKAPRFWPNRRCWNAQCLRSSMRIYFGGRPANFRPTAAKALIQRYSPLGGKLVDFSAGYGGRMLAAMAARRSYLGIDPSSSQIAGLRRMRQDVGALVQTDIELVHGCAEDVLPTLQTGIVDLVLSSPPYFDLEKYSDEPTQSYIRFPTYVEWKRHFLAVVVAQSHRLLRPGGYLLINVADVRPYPIHADTCKFAKKFFRRRSRLKMLMRALPSYDSHRPVTAFRWEPILVFRKTGSSR